MLEPLKATVDIPFFSPSDPYPLNSKNLLHNFGEFVSGNIIFNMIGR
jgi:hypothetical protein